MWKNPRLFLLLAILLSACGLAGGQSPVETGEVNSSPTAPAPQIASPGVTATSLAPAAESGPAEAASSSGETTSMPELPDMPAGPTAPSTASEWARRASLLEPNSETAVALAGGRIYVIGGYPASRSSVDTVQVYNPVQDTWSLASPLPQMVNHAMAAGLNGRVYLIGGQQAASGGGPFLDSVFEYDPERNVWSGRAPMPTARGGGVAVALDGMIYVAGGRPPHGSVFQAYDPVLDTWTELPDMPTGRNHLAGAAIADKIYVVGGRFGAGYNSEVTAVLEVFDPAGGTWAALAPMPTARGGLNAVSANGCLHVFGGEGSAGMFAQHEVYDPFSRAWYALEPMPVPIHGVTGAAFLDGWIYLPGGGTAVGGSSGSILHQVVRTEIACGPP